MKPIPIEAAKLVADRFGYDQVVIVARSVGSDGGEHVTTYGRSVAHCSVAARMGKFFKHELMGWPREDAPLTDEQITAIRDEHLPSQGEPFDCIAFARSVLAVQRAKNSSKHKQPSAAQGEGT